MQNVITVGLFLSLPRDRDHVTSRALPDAPRFQVRFFSAGESQERPVRSKSASETQCVTRDGLGCRAKKKKKKTPFIWIRLLLMHHFLSRQVQGGSSGEGKSTPQRNTFMIRAQEEDIRREQSRAEAGRIQPPPTPPPTL